MITARQAAQHMRETGQTITPDECDRMADGLRSMLRCEPDWERTARSATPGAEGA